MVMFSLTVYFKVFILFYLLFILPFVSRKQRNPHLKKLIEPFENHSAFSAVVIWSYTFMKQPENITFFHIQK